MPIILKLQIGNINHNKFNKDSKKNLCYTKHNQC